jgi:guanosine-3',5'-bis(diphosphate) 3'-pyrophosphohydrolase
LPTPAAADVLAATVKAKAHAEITLLMDALAFSAYKHRNQRRKDVEASPYINHPIALARVLAVEGQITDHKTLAAAILHDTLEDTETTYEELKEKFGRTVAETVREVTDDKTLPKKDRKQLQIEHAKHLSRRARLVKLADKTCNVRDMSAHPPHGWPLERRREYFDWAKRVVEQIRGTHEQLEAAFDEAFAARP